MLWPKIQNVIYDLTITSKAISDLRYNEFPSSDQCYITVDIILEGFLLISPGCVKEGVKLREKDVTMPSRDLL